ncbi:Type 1 glutamine amidotransferase-like domain-containing protein [Ureibacillus manganicus]|uniref:Peptidase n=1 Tax=Ureibacillus manganicus DSM 26584 TaxID=1384049 RepID=A0A0A3IAJ2_9BACL|nr:peptidase E [Ureibacillus manganicus]KGR80505.1 peptidase [Ureibacillus manganicus DSM 26584]
MRQIIALGGGGFSMEPNNLALDEYILKQSNKKQPKICFIPTASGDAEGYIARFYESFQKLPCEPSHLSLFKPPTRDLEGFVLEKDILYVGGGNTKNLLALWNEWGLDKIVRLAYEQGVILSGLSAGSICWFEEGLTDSYGDQLDPINGLGLLKGSHCPHYDGEELRRPTYQNYIQTNRLKPGIAADDGVGIHYLDGEVNKIVSSRPNAKAYHVTAFDGAFIEKQLETEYLC